MLYRNARLFQVVLPCLLDLLLVLEKSPTLAVAFQRPNRYDTMLRLVLSHMEVDHKLPLRRVYAGILPLFIDRWVRLVSVCTQCFTSSEANLGPC